MDYILSAFASWVVGIIFGKHAQHIALIVIGFIFPSKFNLTGKWKAQYNEYNRSMVRINVEEVIRIKQLGNLILGECINSANMGPRFLFKGRINKNCILGHFYIDKCKSPEGCGAFQILYVEDKLIGKCIWYDRDHKIIDSSEYIWIKDDRLD